MTKLNSVPVSLKNRPRIPTPDVTKEVVDREQRLALSAANAANIGAGVVGVIPANGHYSTDLSVVQVVLSPIAETETSPPGGKSGTAALAQAVLSPTLTSAGLMAPLMTMSQLTQLGIVTTAASSIARINDVQNSNFQATLTEVNSSEEEGSVSASHSTTSRNGSIAGREERSTPLIGERHSPLGSQGSTPTFDSYNERSAILMSPDKLTGYIIGPETHTKATNTEARGRRSTSLPCPPAMMQVRDDRSLSLPHSPGLQHRDARPISATNKHVNPTIGGLNSANQEGRQRTSSVGRETIKPRNQEPHRRISTPASTNTKLLAGNIQRTEIPGSNRGEVYV